jgi:hypothetical protein
MRGAVSELYRDGEVVSFIVDDVMIYCDVGNGHPLARSWDGYVIALARSLPRIERCLIVPSSGGLTASQRQQVRRLFGKRPSAILTASLINRGIITSMSWFGMPARAFAPGAYREALGWLEREHLLAEVLAAFERFGAPVANRLLQA